MFTYWQLEISSGWRRSFTHMSINAYSKCYVLELYIWRFNSELEKLMFSLYTRNEITAQQEKRKKTTAHRLVSKFVQ